MEESIQHELEKILSDLERISDLVAQKEAELGLVRELSLVAHDETCYELKLDEQVFYLDRPLMQALFDRLEALGFGELL
ncbi:MAG: hypothetical protein AB7E49_07100 [Campylobacterales bacterium]